MAPLTFNSNSQNQLLQGLTPLATSLPALPQWKAVRLFNLHPPAKTFIPFRILEQPTGFLNVQNRFDLPSREFLDSLTFFRSPRNLEEQAGQCREEAFDFLDSFKQGYEAVVQFWQSPLQNLSGFFNSFTHELGLHTFFKFGFLENIFSQNLFSGAKALFSNGLNFAKATLQPAVDDFKNHAAETMATLHQTSDHVSRFLEPRFSRWRSEFDRVIPDPQNKIASFRKHLKKIRIIKKEKNPDLTKPGSSKTDPKPFLNHKADETVSVAKPALGGKSLGIKPQPEKVVRVFPGDVKPSKHLQPEPRPISGNPTLSKPLPSKSYFSRDSIRDILKPLLFSSPTLEFPHLVRPSGATARQITTSVGLGPGRIALRLTLSEASKIIAAHLELILGPKLFVPSIGGSVGLDWSDKIKKIIVTCFLRQQWSVLFSTRNLIRWVSGELLQKIAELKPFELETILNGIGRSFPHQFDPTHLREAYNLLKTKGTEAAAGFLKLHYPKMDQALLRTLLLTPWQGFKVFLAEFASMVGVSALVRKVLPEGNLSRAMQQSAAYVVSQLFRVGSNAAITLGAKAKALLPLAKALPAALAEALPVAAIHYGVSSLHQAVAKTLHWSESTASATVRKLLVDDVGSLALYGAAKKIITPDRIRVAAELLQTSARAVVASVKSAVTPDRIRFISHSLKNPAVAAVAVGALDAIAVVAIGRDAYYRKYVVGNDQARINQIAALLVENRHEKEGQPKRGLLEGILYYFNSHRHDAKVAEQNPWAVEEANKIKEFLNG